MRRLATSEADLTEYAFAAPDASCSLSDLKARLDRSRGRVRGRLVVNGLLRSLIVAVFAYVLLELTRLLGGPGIVPALDGRAFLEVFCGILLVGAAWSLLRAWRRTPDLLQVAQWADRRFDLNERISTSMVILKKGTGSTVEKALLRDAASHAGIIDPRLLVPTPIPRASIVLAVLLGLALLLPLLPRTTRTAGAVTPAAMAPAGGVPAQTGAHVQQVAELVARKAEEQHDPYLRAVANAFDDLGAKIERGELAQGELAAELDRLVEHLGRALGQDVAEASTLLAPVSDLLETAADPGSSTDPSAAPGSAGNRRDGHAADSGLGPAEGGAGRDGPGAENTALGDGGAVDPSDVLAHLGGPQQAPDAAASGSHAGAPRFTGDVKPKADASGSYTDAIGGDFHQDRPPGPPQGAAFQSGEAPAGAVPQTGQGSSNEAGNGVQAPAEGAEALSAPEGGTPLEQVRLPASQRGPGGSIHVEIPPEAMASLVQDAQGGEAGPWRRYDEAPVSGALVSAIYREVVSRYFVPSQKPAEGRTQP